MILSIDDDRNTIGKNNWNIEIEFVGLSHIFYYKGLVVCYSLELFLQFIIY